MEILATLADLILPAGCAGCGVAGHGGLCEPCAVALRPAPAPALPTPVPAGLPECLTGGHYEGVLREAILAYKERGRRGLAGVLGDALARVVHAGWPASIGPVVLVPVPATAAAARARLGDHMLRLARRAADHLRRSGLAVAVAVPVYARPKADSAHLDRAGRAAAAREGFALRAAWAPRGTPAPRRLLALREVADRGAVVLVDDVLTTGATMAAVAGLLREAGVDVAFAATLAATRLRGRPAPPLAQITVAGWRDGG